MMQCNITSLSLKKIAEQDGGKFEAAVYAAQCSNLQRILPICTDWEVFFPTKFSERFRQIDSYVIIS